MPNYTTSDQNVADRCYRAKENLETITETFNEGTFTGRITVVHKMADSDERLWVIQVVPHTH